MPEAILSLVQRLIEVKAELKLMASRHLRATQAVVQLDAEMADKSKQLHQLQEDLQKKIDEL